MTVGGPRPVSVETRKSLTETDSGPTNEPMAAAVEPNVRKLRTALSLVGIYVVVRVGLLAIDALSGSGGRQFFRPLSSWDGNWYLRIAARGYPPNPATAAGHLT